MKVPCVVMKIRDRSLLARTVLLNEVLTEVDLEGIQGRPLVWHCRSPA